MVLTSDAKAERGRETLENATHAKKPRKGEKRAEKDEGPKRTQKCRNTNSPRQFIHSNATQ